MFTIVIDETGDTGLKNVQADPSIGPSQYFCICATFFRDENTTAIESELQKLINHKGLIRANKMFWSCHGSVPVFFEQYLL